MSIGAKYFKDQNKQKVSGADMLPGVLLALSYEKSPINPAMYLSDNEKAYLSISWENLGAFIDQLAEDMNKEFKPLTFGSAKQYLSAMRKGYRANRNGILPPLDVTLSEEEMMVYIPKRSFKEDVENFLQPFSDGALHWMFGTVSNKTS